MPRFAVLFWSLTGFTREFLHDLEGDAMTEIESSIGCRGIATNGCNGLPFGESLQTVLLNRECTGANAPYAARDLTWWDG